MKQFDSHWTDFREILYWRFVLKYADQIQKSGRNNRHLVYKNSCVGVRNLAIFEVQHLAVYEISTVEAEGPKK